MGRYAIGFFASVNLSGWKQWPDGWGYGDLHHLQTELRGCSCGALFWPKGSWFQTNETDLSVITEPDAEPEPEPDEEPEPTPKGCFVSWRQQPLFATPSSFPFFALRPQHLQA